MGRKVNNKSAIKKEIVKEPSFKSLPVKKRNEVTQLADKLLRICTTPATQNKTKSVELHREIDEIITKITNLEAILETPVGNRNSAATIKKFTKWASENGAKFEGLTIHEYPGYELGLKTDKEISEGSLVIAVPRKLMLTTETASQSLIGPLITKDRMLQKMPNVALAMFLLIEKFSNNSFWKPYIDILPTKYTTVLYFTTKELLELDNSPSLEPALNIIKSIARQYAYFNKLIQTSDDPASELLKNIFTYEQYRWAVSTVMTRQNSVPSEDGSHMINALIPMWDLCNHTNANISTEYNPELQRSECVAIKNFKEEEQLFIFYGVRSNSDLFVHNGFVFEDNAHDGYWLRLGVSKSDRLHEKKASLLGKINVPVHGEFWLKTGLEPLDGQLIAFLRVFNMGEEQLDIWLASDKPADLQFQDCALPTDLENKTWTFLQTRLKLILSTYKTNLKEDEKILIDIDSSCKKLAIQMRITEKRILEGALNYVEQRIKK